MNVLNTIYSMYSMNKGSNDKKSLFYIDRFNDLIPTKGVAQQSVSFKLKEFFNRKM